MEKKNSSWGDCTTTISSEGVGDLKCYDDYDDDTQCMYLLSTLTRSTTAFLYIFVALIYFVAKIVYESFDRFILFVCLIWLVFSSHYKTS